MTAYQVELGTFRQRRQAEIGAAIRCSRFLPQHVEQGMEQKTLPMRGLDDVRAAFSLAALACDMRGVITLRRCRHALDRGDDTH